MIELQCNFDYALKFLTKYESKNFSKTHTIAILFNYRQNKCSNFEWATMKKKIFEWAFSNK